MKVRIFILKAEFLIGCYNGYEIKKVQGETFMLTLQMVLYLFVAFLIAGIVVLIGKI